MWSYMLQEKKFQILDSRLNQKEKNRDDKHDDYLEWWTKSKKRKTMH